MIQPKVNDHRVGIILSRDMDDLHCFSNEGSEYTKADLSHFKTDIVSFFQWLYVERGFPVPSGEFPYMLDCGVMGPAYGEPASTLIVHDLPKESKPYNRRYAMLSNFFGTWMMDETTTGVQVLPVWQKYLMPVFWTYMKELNQKQGKNLYEGFVCKDPNSKYPKVSNKKKYPFWVKYRFDQLN